MGLLEKFPIVPKFCCCINLRVGCAVIGSFLLCSMTTLYSIIVGILFKSPMITEVTDEEVCNFLVLWFLLLVYVVPKTILNIILIIGAVKKKSSLLGIHLWCNLIYTLLEAFALIAVLVLVTLNFLDWDKFLAFLIEFLIQIYFWICIDSYYVALKLENRLSVHSRSPFTIMPPIASRQNSNNVEESFPLQRFISKPPPHVKILS